MLASRRRLIQRALAAACLGWRTGSADATSAAWPARPIRLIVVYPVGGVSDLIARALAHQLAALLGTAIVVENRAGAGGSSGMTALASAKPDGYTLAFSAITPLSLYPHLAKTKYDPLKDIVPLAGVMNTPALLVGTRAFDGETFADLLAPASPRPVSLRWATTGFGTTGHMVLEQVRLATGLPISHIPYKGGGSQLNDAVAGQFELLSTNAGATQLAYIRLGKLKPLAVGAPSRLDSLPTVPTFDELGLPQANLSSLFGLFAPAGVPEPLLDRLNSAVNEVLQQAEMRSLLAANDSLPLVGSPASFARRIRVESENNRRLIRATRMTRID
jgi:tripartite-type tricarboxylate transporter receptor subunit TctC